MVLGLKGGSLVFFDSFWFHPALSRENREPVSVRGLTGPESEDPVARARDCSLYSQQPNGEFINLSGETFLFGTSFYISLL